MSFGTWTRMTVMSEKKYKSKNQEISWTRFDNEDDGDYSCCLMTIDA